MNSYYITWRWTWRPAVSYSVITEIRTGHFRSPTVSHGIRRQNSCWEINWMSHRSQRWGRACVRKRSKDGLPVQLGGNPEPSHTFEMPFSHQVHIKHLNDMLLYWGHYSYLIFTSRLGADTSHSLQVNAVMSPLKTGCSSACSFLWTLRRWRFPIRCCSSVSWDEQGTWGRQCWKQVVCIITSSNILS